MPLRACTTIAAAPATWGEAIDVPLALALPWFGQARMIVPVAAHDEEIVTPGAITSGPVLPIRSPRNTVCPSAPIGAAAPLSNSRPLDENEPRSRLTEPAATEMTQGAWLNGLTLASAFSAPELPAEKTTTAPLSVTALVATFTGSAG